MTLLKFMVNKWLRCLKERILVLQDNENQNPNAFYTNKYQIHVACSYGYELVYANDKCSKSLKSYIGQDCVSDLTKNL